MISRLIENQKPNWPPGLHVGYHVITHGWVIDQLIRRVDKKKRSLSQFFEEEIRLKYSYKFSASTVIADSNVNNLFIDIDFYIGLPLSLNDKVARIRPLSWSQTFKNWMDLTTLKYDLWSFLDPQPLQIKAWQNPAFLFENVKQHKSDCRQ